MWKLEFQISGLPADDGERRQKRDSDTPRNRNAIWLVAGFVLAYLLGAGAQSGSGVAIISPTNGTSTLDAQVVVLGTITGFQGSLVTLRVNETTQTAPVTNDIFQSQINLAVGRNDIRASSGDLESEPITIIRKARPFLKINLPAAVSTTQDAEVEVLGTVENLDGDSINLEVNDEIPRNLQAAGGRFSTKVQLVVGTNTIRALASGSDPAAVIVVRTEAAKPAIVITSPASGFTADGDSVQVTGTIVNSDAPAIKLQRNDFSTQVAVAASQFKYRMNLDVGRNEIRASLGDVVSDVVIVNRKPTRIVIATDPPVSNLFLTSRAPITRVQINGSVENSDAETVMLNINEAGRPVLVRDRKFEFPLAMKPGASYRIHASLGDVVSNEIVINVPSAQTMVPDGSGSTVAPGECARIQCDCDNVRLPVSDAAQPRTFYRMPTKGELLELRKRCLATQQRLRIECEKTLQWPGPCPAETSGPNAWRSSLQKKSRALSK
ncbi:MAG: hypothetical protein AABN33_21650 [Acidobacteriota bacterium]